MPGTILVGYDGSDASKLALEHGIELCKASGSAMLLCSVVPAGLQHMAFSELLLPGIDLGKLVQPERFIDTARKRLEEVAAAARGRGVEVRIAVRAGDAADELLAAAEEAGAAHIVLGYKSYENALRYGIGSVADKVLRHAGRTVTIVRPASAAPAKSPKARGPKP